jgi:hypothetical protein
MQLLNQIKGINKVKKAHEKRNAPQAHPRLKMAQQMTPHIRRSSIGISHEGMHRSIPCPKCRPFPVPKVQKLKVGLRCYQQTKENVTHPEPFPPTVGCMPSEGSR